MIELEKLTKNFGEKEIVKGLSLKIEENEIFALLGPNGAGKTTTIRMLTTLSQPTAGTARIAGFDIRKETLQVKRSIGVVPQQLNIERELTAWENLELHGMLYHLPKKLRRERMEELLNYVGLSDRTRDRVRKFSGGMVRRLMIARALMHRPKVLFLDEPTVGLDPQSRRRIWDLIKVMRREGMTVLLTTHYIEEAESLCDRVGIIDHGELIALGTAEELKKRVGNSVLEYLVDDATQRKFFASREEALNYAKSLTQGFSIRDTNLEDVFVQLTGKGGF